MAFTCGFRKKNVIPDFLLTVIRNYLLSGIQILLKILILNYPKYAILNFLMQALLPAGLPMILFDVFRQMARFCGFLFLFPVYRFVQVQLVCFLVIRCAMKVRPTEGFGRLVLTCECRFVAFLPMKISLFRLRFAADWLPVACAAE